MRPRLGDRGHITLKHACVANSSPAAVGSTHATPGKPNGAKNSHGTPHCNRFFHVCLFGKRLPALCWQSRAGGHWGKGTFVLCLVSTGDRCGRDARAPRWKMPRRGVARASARAVPRLIRPPSAGAIGGIGYAGMPLSFTTQKGHARQPLLTCLRAPSRPSRWKLSPAGTSAKGNGAKSIDLGGFRWLQSRRRDCGAGKTGCG